MLFSAAMLAFLAVQGGYMEITGLRDIFLSKEDFMENEVTVSGWVRSNRDSKSFGFLTISDGTFFTPLQVVITRK